MTSLLERLGHPLWVCLLVAAAAGGCETVLFRTHDVVTVEYDAGRETALGSTRLVRLRLSPREAPGTVGFELVDSVRVRSLLRRTVERWGYVHTRDPITKSAELLAVPPLLVGTVLWKVFFSWLVPEGEGPGRYVPPRPPHDSPMATYAEEHRNRALFGVAGRPDLPTAFWHFFTTLGMAPFFPYDPASITLESLGDPEPGPWVPAVRTREAVVAATLVRCAVDGQDLTARAAAGRLDLAHCLAALSGDEGRLEVALKGGDGKTYQGSLRLARGTLQGLIALDEAERELRAAPRLAGVTEILAEAALLGARWGRVETAALRLEAYLALEGEKTSRLDRARAFYEALAARYKDEPERRYFAAALAGFHLDVLAGKHEAWAAWSETDRWQLLYEHAGASAPLDRARGAVVLALRKDVLPPREKSSLLCGLLGAETAKLARWAQLWALARTREPAALVVLQAYLKQETDPLLRARAWRTVLLYFERTRQEALVRKGPS